jgi:hypothetical protein
MKYFPLDSKQQSINQYLIAAYIPYHVVRTFSGVSENFIEMRCETTGTTTFDYQRIEKCLKRLHCA